MTAKSETVGVVKLQRYDPALNDSEYMDGTKVASMDPYTEGRFVLFTDHESALAELESQRTEQWRQRREADGSRDVALAVCESLRHEREQLISGLEALAGELERTGRANWTHPKREAFANRLRALIPAAANTESEEGHGND